MLVFRMFSLQVIVSLLLYLKHTSSRDVHLPSYMVDRQLTTLPPPLFNVQPSPDADTPRQLTMSSVIKEPTKCEELCGIHPSICANEEGPPLVVPKRTQAPTFRSFYSKSSPIENYPFMGLLVIRVFNTILNYCSAVLVHPEIMITAAQCGLVRKMNYDMVKNNKTNEEAGVDDDGYIWIQPKDMLIVLDQAPHFFSSEDQIKVVEYVVHPNYDPTSPINNIMILKLIRPIVVSKGNVRYVPVCLGQHHQNVLDEYVHFLGFGSHFVKNSENEIVHKGEGMLRDITMRVANDTICRRNNLRVAPGAVFCAGQQDRVLGDGDMGGVIIASRPIDDNHMQTFAIGMAVNHHQLATNPAYIRQFGDGVKYPSTFIRYGDHCCFIQYATRNHVTCKTFTKNAEVLACPKEEFFVPESSRKFKEVVKRKRQLKGPTEIDYQRLAQRVVQESNGKPVVATESMKRGINDAVAMLHNAPDREQALRSIKAAAARTAYHRTVIRNTQPASSPVYKQASDLNYVTQQLANAVEKAASNINHTVFH